MSSDLMSAMGAAATGLRAQTVRIRISAENLAHADATATTPGGDPYRRRTVTFRNRMDREAGVETVRVARIGTAQGDFPVRYDPSHPAADARGYVRVPNVDSVIETIDMREAQRTYAANLSVLEVTRGMITRTIEALRQ